jgi:hypothetical protein
MESARKMLSAARQVVGYQLALGQRGIESIDTVGFGDVK